MPERQPPASPPAPRPLSFLSFDFGARRVGVACGNTLLRSASPLQTVAALGDARFEAIGRLVREWQPDALVVGVLNLWVAFNFSTDTWVSFKLFGGMGLMIVFIVLQGLFLARYIPEEKEQPVPQPAVTEKE